MYVIAGATGHVGSVVASELLAQKEKVKVIVRDGNKGSSWSQRGAEVSVGSLDDRPFLVGALKGASGFFTLLPPNFAATDFYAEQRRVADVIASAVKESGVPHVVMLSSIGADLPDKTGPIKGLHYLENALRSTGAKVTALRAGSFQENVAQSIAPAKHQGIYPNFVASADEAYPMVATKDIGKVAVQSLRNPPSKSEIVDVQGPAYSPRQLAEKLGAAIGKKLQIVDIQPRDQVEALKKGGIPPHVAAVFAEMYAAFASGNIRPRGDRSVTGATSIDQVLSNIVR